MSRAVFSFRGRVAMEKMADGPPISVLKLAVSQNFYNKLQHVITSLTFSLQLFLLRMLFA